MIYIRADANQSIGMGHIMRCLSIADAFHNLGHVVTFILADDSVEQLVINRNYKAIVLYSDYQVMETELPLWDSQGVPSSEGEDIIIVDSYFVSPFYLLSLERRVGNGKLVYIDDLAAFPYPVDILVNYNVYGQELDYHDLYLNSDAKEPKFILGCSCAPLREMFRGIEQRMQEREVKEVLISTGGSDPEHIALSIVKSEPKNYNYHILIGAMSPDKDKIERLAGENEHIVLHENVVDMRGLINRCDIAVSAAGSTLYEICACGVPLITYIFADNQIRAAEAFQKLGVAINLGDMRKENSPAEKVLIAIEKLSYDYERRCSVGNRMQNMIDGFGADRMVEKILK